MDDMLSTGQKHIPDAMVSELEQKYKIHVEWVGVGDELSFLKRRHFLLLETELVIQIDRKHLEKLKQLT